MTDQLLRSRLCRVYHLNPAADDDSVIRAAENAATTGGTLAGILAALGVTDPDAAPKAVGELMAARNRLQELMGELDGLMRADSEADAAMAPQDASAAMAARGWRDPSQVPALVAHRLSVIEGEVAKLQKGKDGPAERRLARERGRQAFFAMYGVNLNPALAHLTQTFIAGRGVTGATVQYAAPIPAPAPLLQTTFGYAPQGQPLQLGGGQPPAPEPVDVTRYSGRNTTEKIMSYLSSLDPKFADLAIGERIRRASEWRKSQPQAAN